jgi:hypothetical protein
MAMTLWEFPLADDDGTAIGQTVLAEGLNETDAAAAAVVALAIPHSVCLGSGQVVPPEAEIRWRELYGIALPGVVSDSGRLVIYTRSI